jgi:hypothetical protein
VNVSAPAVHPPRTWTTCNSASPRARLRPPSLSCGGRRTSAASRLPSPRPASTRPVIAKLENPEAVKGRSTAPHLWPTASMVARADLGRRTAARSGAHAAEADQPGGQPRRRARIHRYPMHDP